MGKMGTLIEGIIYLFINKKIMDFFSSHALNIFLFS